jgi:hypothetical protein
MVLGRSQARLSFFYALLLSLTIWADSGRSNFAVHHVTFHSQHVDGSAFPLESSRCWPGQNFVAPLILTLRGNVGNHPRKSLCSMLSKTLGRRMPDLNKPSFVSSFLPARKMTELVTTKMTLPHTQEQTTTVCNLRKNNSATTITINRQEQHRQAHENQREKRDERTAQGVGAKHNKRVSANRTKRSPLDYDSDEDGDLETSLERIRQELHDENLSTNIQFKAVKASYSMNKLKKLQSESENIDTAIILLSRIVAAALEKARADNITSNMTGMQISIALNAVGGREGCELLLTSAFNTLIQVHHAPCMQP